MVRQFSECNLLGCVCICLLVSTSVNGAALRHGHGNEVVKENSEGTEPRRIKPGQLEAFYYSMYGDQAMANHSLWQKGRLGEVNKTDSCTWVRAVPSYLRHSINFRPSGISVYYQKFTETYGIPVVGSSEVSDAALSRACYVLRFLLSDRDDMRTAYFRSYGRVAIIPQDGAIRALPEYEFLPEPFDVATPGLGAIPSAPVSSAKENNVLCWRNDSHGREDILIREIGQGIFHLAAKTLDPGLENHLGNLYDRAIASRWWRKTYAELSPDSYFGEGLQSYFNVNAFSNNPNGEHNRVSTRTKLCAYDPALFQLIHKLWPCGNHYIKRCLSRGAEFYQKMNMDCPLGQWYSRATFRK